MDKSKAAFFKATDKKGLTAVKVAVRFPYADHEGFEAFTVEYKGRTFYYCFGSDNQLIQTRLD